MSAQAGLRTAPRPADPAAPPRRRIARWRAPVALGAVVAGLVAGQLAALGVILAGGGRSAPAEVDGIAAVAAALVLLGVVWAFAHRGADPLTPATMGIRRTAFWPALGWALTIMIGVTAAEGLYLLLSGAGAGEEAAAAGGRMSTPAALLLLAGVAVFVPIAEEVAFRGYLFPALTRWSGPWKAALIAAVLFGAAHVLAYPPEVLPALTFFGFGACLLYWMTGSLLPCIALHALNNGIVIAATSDVAPGVVAAALLAPVIALAICWPFARERAPQDNVNQQSEE
jgi:membrane protease YdiL (CAAX protease family)